MAHRLSTRITLELDLTVEDGDLEEAKKTAIQECRAQGIVVEQEVTVDSGCDEVGR
jgi:hypothetical protein